LTPDKIGTRPILAGCLEYINATLGAGYLPSEDRSQLALAIRFSGSRIILLFRPSHRVAFEPDSGLTRNAFSEFRSRLQQRGLRWSLTTFPQLQAGSD